MTERKKPSELTLVTDNTGEVIEALPELTPEERKLNTLRGHLYRGSRVFDIEPVRWIIPKWLPASAVSAIYSAPGVGKSSYALSLALEVASGGSWCGHKLDPAPVLYVAAERAALTRDRLEAWQVHTGRQVPENFSTLYYAPHLLSHTEALSELIKETGARLVVLDTYARVTVGTEENSAKDSGLMQEQLAKLARSVEGVAVLVVHHSGKDSGKGLRGSTAFLGAVDLTIELSTVSADIVQAKVTKSNAARTPIPEHFRFEPVLLDPEPGEVEKREAAVLISTTYQAAVSDLGVSVLELLRETPGGLTQAEIVRGCGGPRSSAQRALKALCDSGQVIAPSDPAKRGARYTLSE